MAKYFISSVFIAHNIAGFGVQLLHINPVAVGITE